MSAELTIRPLLAGRWLGQVTAREALERLAVLDAVHLTERLVELDLRRACFERMLEGQQRELLLATARLALALPPPLLWLVKVLGAWDRWRAAR